MQGRTLAARTHGLGLCLAALVVLGGLGAQAQYPDGGPVTVGPFVGYRFGGELKDMQTGASIDLESGPAYGVVFDWGRDVNLLRLAVAVAIAVALAITRTRESTTTH